MGKYKNIFFYSLIGVLSIALFQFYMIYADKKDESYESTYYPLINNKKEEYRGKIIGIELSNISRNTYLIDLSNNQRFKIYFFSFLQVGDSIYKPINTDSLYIFSKNGDSIFRLDPMMNIN